jgi:signal peptidase I
MDVHFDAGDIILIKNIDNSEKLTLKAGDIIAFMSTNTESYGETVTHMIREVKLKSDGSVLGYVTYGTNTGVNDEAVVEPEYILGKYSGKMPIVGQFFAFVKTVPGYIVCILVPFLLLILYNGVNVIRLFRKYRKEQMEEMQAERNKIEEERAEAQRMMAELMELKAQLAKKDEVATPPAAPASEEKAAETATEEASAEEDATEKTATEEAGAEKAVAEEPKAEEKPADEEVQLSLDEEAIQEEPKAEEPKAEETVKEESVVEEDPAVEEPAPKKAKTEPLEKNNIWHNANLWLHMLGIGEKPATNKAEKKAKKAAEKAKKKEQKNKKTVRMEIVINENQSCGSTYSNGVHVDLVVNNHSGKELELTEKDVEFEIVKLCK